MRAGTAASPVMLTKRWFEGDTIYILTFRNSRLDSNGETKSHGFFKSELKRFGRALEIALKTDSTQEVRMKNVTIIFRNVASGKKYIECKFSSTDSLFVREEDVQKLLNVIKRQ